jgi:hypothetical protein
MTKPSTKPSSKATTLTLKGGAEAKSQDRLLAQLAVEGLSGNAFTVVQFAKGTYGELSLNECIQCLAETVATVRGGSTNSAEMMLVAQASSLNAIFGELARRAALNMGEHLNATETYMRLALKAQAQSRATLEALAEIKNPRPVSFVKQANIANGPQQVNNGANSDGATVRAGSRAGDSEKLQNELLKAQHGDELDTGAPGPTGRADPHLEAVGAGNRAAHG